MDESIALVEFSKHHRSVCVETVAYAHIEVGLLILFPRRCFGGVAFAAAPLVVEREDELVAFTAGTFLALSLYSLAPQALETLRDIRGTAPRSLASAWCLFLVASVVRFLLFITELESAVPAHTEL